MTLKTGMLFAFFMALVCPGLELSAQDQILNPESFLLNQHPPHIMTYFQQNSVGQSVFNLNSSKVSETCHFLTDSDVKQFKKWALPKRKKAFKRRVKQICEVMEEAIFDQRPLVSSEINLIYELEAYNASYIDRAVIDNSKITIFDKLKMFISSHFKRYSVSPSKKLKLADEAQNLMLLDGSKFLDMTAIELSEIDSVDSPYWHAEDKNVSLEKRFKKLAKLKKIKSIKPLYVLLDGPSLDGSSPKIKAIDLDLDNEWSIKWGDEIHSDVVGSRLFSALGFDIDHPYFYKGDELKLIIPQMTIYNSKEKLVEKMLEVYKIDIRHFIKGQGVISDSDIKENSSLIPMKGLPYITFKGSLVEGRPDRVKRLGGFLDQTSASRRELRGALLANLWIDNWDTKKENTLLTTIHLGKHHYRASGIFSDLGTSFGVDLNTIPADFRVGLVNRYAWKMLEVEGDEIHFKGRMNSTLDIFKAATYSDLRWMATKIAKIDENILKEILDKSGWPKPIQHLYFHKLAARRHQILTAFKIEDPHSIFFDEHFTELPYVKNGELIEDIKNEDYPLGFMSKKGRFRNYGN